MIGVCARPECFRPTLNHALCEIHKPSKWEIILASRK